MPLSLQPAPGFDWLAVSWGAPDQQRTETCSLCDAPLGDDEVPLTISNAQGWLAEFCEGCQFRWWGVERLA